MSQTTFQTTKGVASLKEQLNSLSDIKLVESFTAHKTPRNKKYLKLQLEDGTEAIIMSSYIDEAVENGQLIENGDELSVNTDDCWTNDAGQLMITKKGESSFKF